MTEEEIIDRIHEIGQTFANDLHDGDGPVLYEGVNVHFFDDGKHRLVYAATLEDESSVDAVFELKLISIDVISPGD